MARHKLEGRMASLLTVASLAAPAMRVQGAEDWAGMTPEERLEKVLSLRHGPVGPHLDDDTRQLVNSVLDNPETYCPLLDEQLCLPDQPLDLADFGVYTRLASALGLAELLGRDYCGSTVDRFFDETADSYQLFRGSALDDRGTSKERHEAKQNCAHLFIVTLRILEEFDDPHALDRCLCMIDKFRPAKGDAGEVYVMLKYMAQVAPQRADCKPELERLYNDRQSHLYHQPRLAQVIEAIEARQAFEKSGEANQ